MKASQSITMAAFDFYRNNLLISLDLSRWKSISLLNMAIFQGKFLLDLVVLQPKNVVFLVKLQGKTLEIPLDCVKSRLLDFMRVLLRWLEGDCIWLCVLNVKGNRF